MFIRQWIKFLVGSGFALVSGCGVAGTLSGCNISELIQGQDYYNELVCSGIAYTASGKYARAVNLFEKALAVKLYDSPNFELFPRLAWVRFKNGNLSAAKDDLKRAELSLSVFTGLIHCQETDKGFNLKNNAGISLAGNISDEISGVMCGAAYDYVYRRESLDRVLLEAELVKYYLDVKKKIYSVGK